MLGKLFKYEFKSTVRVLGVIYLAILVCAAVLGFVARAGVMNIPFASGSGAEAAAGASSAGQRLDTVIMIFVLIYMFLIMAMFVLTVVMIITRFYKNLLQGEGYLMHTLPVPTWMLVASKTLSALLWIVLGFLVVMASGCLVLLTSGEWKALWTSAFFNEIQYILSQMNFSSVLTIALVIVELISFVLTIYFCLSVGSIANRHKIAASFLTFVGVWIVMAVISVPVQSGLFGWMMGNSYSAPAGAGQIDAAARSVLYAAEVRQLILYLIYSVLFFFGTTVTLQKRLNLE